MGAALRSAHQRPHRALFSQPSHSQALAPLAAAVSQNLATIGSPHPLEKPMRTCAFNSRRLICPFHVTIPSFISGGSYMAAGPCVKSNLSSIVVDMFMTGELQSARF